MKKTVYLALFIALLSCQNQKEKISVIFDTDANNELDDQHALAYLFSNGNVFNILGVTVNATRNGGAINEQYTEAKRIFDLYNIGAKIPLLKGANLSYSQIDSTWNAQAFDGQEAVDFILEKTKETQGTVLVAVGKLTNVALALKKDPTLAQRTKVVWLGSNYPEPGEYNQMNDTTAMNYVLASNIPFELVPARYGEPSGTDAVRATPDEIAQKMPKTGPQALSAIEGRNGGTFTHFGDYSINLFSNIDLHGDPPSRALFDMVCVAILKNPSWGQQSTIPAPVYFGDKWVERPNNPRKIGLWENFNKEAIMADFYDRMKNYQLP